MKRRISAVIVVMSLLPHLSAAAEAARTIKTGLEPADYVYALADGVSTREVFYFSDDVACYGKLFFPKGYSTVGKTPGVVVTSGWAGTHVSVEKYAARFAEKGLVAMVIDYRGWGASDGFTTLATKSLQSRARNDDAKRFTRGEFSVVTKRTRLIPYKQVEDVRSALSFLQGEPGVDADNIGLWGSSFAGGNAIVVAAMDARVKAIAAQAPSIAGKGAPAQAFKLQGKQLEDAIRRARSGQGAEMQTGYAQPRTIDIETNQMVAEYRPFRYLEHIGERPVLFVVAEREQLFNNKDHAYAALDVLTGPKKIVEIPDVAHFELYDDEPFDISANAAAEWFLKYLGTAKKLER